MPYIAQANRNSVEEAGPTDAGELNYLITRLCAYYLGDDYNYSDINEVVGVLECAKLELYRRIAAPYEDLKLKENGDVYDG